MNLSEIAVELAKQNPHIKPIENKEPFTNTFINQGKPELEPVQNKDLDAQSEQVEPESIG